jgi:hypothetical protein
MADEINTAEELIETLPDTTQEEASDTSEPTTTPETVERAEMPTHAMLYAPITRIDKEKREVEGVATSEAVDSFGTIFSYEASKKAFQRWMDRTANVREMHERKAVGKGVGVRFDDENKKIYLRTRVSRGATDSWLKIEDGVLNGYSVGATNPVWDKIERDGKVYPYLVGYDLMETSLVDNASNPDGQGLVIARAEGLTDLVDITPETENTTPVQSGTVVVEPSSLSSSPLVIERAGARVSADTRASLHDARNHQLTGAMKTMKTCGCDDCLKAHNALDPDDDGDIDFLGLNDTDGDAAQPQNDDMERTITAVLERALPQLIAGIERAMSPVYQRQQQFLARLAQTPEPEITTVNTTNTIDTTALEAALETRFNAVLERASLSEVRASLVEQSKALEAVKETVERIEAQPQAGGPVLNGGGHVVDKRLANSPQTQSSAMTQDARRAFFDDLQRRGLLNTPELQMEAAQTAIIRTPGYNG